MFFKKKLDDNKNNDLSKIAALLIHAAKIDELYTEKEKTIIINLINIQSITDMNKRGGMVFRLFKVDSAKLPKQPLPGRRPDY